MSYSNKHKTVNILFPEKKIIYDNKVYVINLIINTNAYSRFEFDNKNFQCKISRDILTITDNRTSNVQTYNKNNTISSDTNIDTETDVYTYYKYHSGITIGINNKKTSVKINDEILQVTVECKKGIYTEYYTEKGTLLLTNVPNRQCMWNNTFITKA